MRTFIKVTSIFILAMVQTIATAQSFQGKATYKTKRALDIKLDSTQVNSEMHERMIAMMKKQFEKTFILSFNKEASIYKEDEALEAPQAGGGMRMMIVTTDGSDILYKNLKENRFASQNEVFGKIFLVKDQLEKLDWTLEGDTKNIGNYTCYKATMKRMVEDVENRISVNDDRDLNDEEAPKMKEITVVAWYTPQIPVNNGPARYQGLPGLILEINNGDETILCSKIVLNSKEQISIKEPSKGKELNQSDYETIIDKRMKEEQERFKSRRNSDHEGGQRIEISIGG